MKNTVRKKFVPLNLRVNIHAMEKANTLTVITDTTTTKAVKPKDDTNPSRLLKAST